MKKFNFYSCGLDYGIYQGATLEESQEAFAHDANYSSWADMVEQAQEFGGNNVEAQEIFI